MEYLIACLECGDTIVDESTRVFTENGDVLSARPFPGAAEALRTLNERGDRLALVVDGRVASFENTPKTLGLWELFEVHAISKSVGADKPNLVMFRTAMDGLRLSSSDAGRMVMIGNNVERDVLGVNAMGMISVLLTCSSRYRLMLTCAEKSPDYRTASPAE